MFSYTRLWLSLIALILIVVFGCVTDPNRDPKCPFCSGCPVIGNLPPPDIESVPETLLVNDRTYIIECDLWRDFMPMSPPDGKHMNASLLWTIFILQGVFFQRFEQVKCFKKTTQKEYGFNILDHLKC